MPTQSASREHGASYRPAALLPPAFIEILNRMFCSHRKAGVAFAEEHAERRSREGMRYIIETMPAAEKNCLRALCDERASSTKRRRRP